MVSPTLTASAPWSMCSAVCRAATTIRPDVVVDEKRVVVEPSVAAVGRIALSPPSPRQVAMPRGPERSPAAKRVVEDQLEVPEPRQQESA
jgi:hypothetical protein